MVNFPGDEIEYKDLISNKVYRVRLLQKIMAYYWDIEYLDGDRKGEIEKTVFIPEII